jgi:hypothetical protein
MSEIEKNVIPNGGNGNYSADSIQVWKDWKQLGNALQCILATQTKKDCTIWFTK